VPKSRRQRAHPHGTNAHNRLIHLPYRVAREAAPDLSREARKRLAMVDWHEAHGRNVARTARHFGYSRPTVYRWLARYDRHRLESLEDRSSAPRRRRRPTWTLRELALVRELRERYPRWGKDKLAVLLRRLGIHLSVSMIGRILERLRRTGELRSRATARLAVELLTAIEQRMPFPIRGLQVDGGSEFMAEFETACADRGSPSSSCRQGAPNSTAPSSGPTGPTPRSSTNARPPSRPSLRWAPSWPSGNERTTMSVPTRPSGTSRRPSTWPLSASMCNGGTGRVHRVDDGLARSYPAAIPRLAPRTPVPRERPSLLLP
jgi:transposase